MFTEAAQVETMARPPLLDDACGDDVELRREVEALLDAHGDAGDFLHDVVTAEARRFASLSPGARIGAYEVVRHLGSGGMGAVYLAVRTDESYEKHVAIKVLRNSIDHDSVLRRFLQERQILARLEHPNIARLFDAATSDDGRPCIVMEYVQGVPIDQYCESKGLSVDERLRLFRTVCSGVQAAHQNLIVHRDLKPGNILVTADGIPKLVDFGIAKLLDGGPGPTNDTTTLTVAAFQPMTPEYASPEQVSRLPITTASDVYSLGVLLYRLLTGHPPYRLDPSRPTDMQRVICEEPPTEPSIAIAQTSASEQTAASSKLGRRLRGDLDTIVLKALSKDPRQRYVSAEHLADDLQRHQEGLPILACRPSYRYRLGKFLGRHRTAAVLAALSVALLLVGVATTSWQTHVARQERLRAEAERSLAEAERNRAEEVSTFLETLFQIPDPHQTQGESISARDLLDRGAERLASQDWDRPDVQARLMSSIGRSYLGLGLYEEASDTLQTTLDLRLRVHGEEHLDVAESLDELAGLRIAKADFESAEELYRRGLALRQRLLGPVHQSVAESLNNLGQTLYSAGDLEAAEPFLRQALEMKQGLPNADRPSLANGLNNLAGLLIARGEYAEAEDLFQQALELRRQSFGTQHPSVAESFNNLGLVFYRQQMFVESEAHLRQALDLRRQLFGDEHPVVAKSLGNLAAVLLVREDFAAAEPMLREALEMKKLLLGPRHPDLVPALNSLGSALEARQELTEAEAIYRQALELQRTALPAGRQRLASSALALGQLLLDRHRPDEAEPFLQEALDIRRALPEGDWRIAEAESAIGALLAANGQHQEAEPLLRESYQRLEATFGAHDRRVRRADRRLRAFSSVQGQDRGEARLRAL